jgi:hypothetical protein
MWLSSGCDVLANLIRNVSDGAECTDPNQCLGDRCLTEGEGFPGGYCTTTQCDTQGCSNIFGAECLLVGTSQGDQPLCFASCESDEDCRDLYSCVDTDGDRICLPNEIAETMPQAGETGTSCSRDADCIGDTCLVNYSGGYCTQLNCTGDGDCSGFGDGRCLRLADDSEVTACFDGCSNDSECRRGYACFNPDGAGGVCLPEDDASPVRNPNGALDGEPCTVDINCRGGTCLREAEGYPGGYCTTLHCNTLGCNGSATTCRTFENDSACFVTCSDNSQCRDGYECLAGGYCDQPVETTVPTDPSGTIDIVCESEAITGGRRFNFNIDGTTESFAVVGIANQSAVIRPDRLRLPDGSIGADFGADYSFLDQNWQFLENLAPLFFPASPQSASITQQGGGMYSMDFLTDDSDPCYYVIQKADEGSRIAVNLYLVGVPNVTEQSAPNDSDLQTVIDEFERIYNNAGIQLTTVRYIEITGTDRDRYRIVRDLGDLYRLVALSESPGPTLAEALSINVFLIQDFAIPSLPGLLGISMGLPGMPGVHGTHGSGLIFTSAPLRENARALGQTMAHEVGHFNGLLHTTEATGETDPIADTPSCRDPNQGAACPDATNLMFPFSIGGISQDQLTAGQSQVLRWSPLVQ